MPELPNVNSCESRKLNTRENAHIEIKVLVAFREKICSSKAKHRNKSSFPLNFYLALCFLCLRTRKLALVMLQVDVKFFEIAKDERQLAGKPELEDGLPWKSQFKEVIL